MTKICALFFTAIFLHHPSSHRPDAKHTETFFKAQTYDSTFTVRNYEPVNIGWVNIHLSDNTYAYINVTGQGTYSTTLQAAPYECSIHGQSFGPNTPTWIVVDAHTAVQLTWTDNVIVVSAEETYGRKMKIRVGFRLWFAPSVGF